MHQTKKKYECFIPNVSFLYPLKMYIGYVEMEYSAKIG